jgi:8-oxo-dGTP pyrophosphatase MutT (NUDIX family)
VTDRGSDRPAWFGEIERALTTITVDDLTRFKPPADTEVRRGAVLMLFGEGPDGADLLLTERNHRMRSHPGQVSFPGGSLDPGESAEQAALREAEEETGLDPVGVEVVGRLPELYLPPSNFAVTPIVAWWRTPSPVSAMSPDEVHEVYRVPLRELVDPDLRITVRSPRGDWTTPGFLIGPDKDVILWGFTGGIIARLMEHVGWIEDLPDAPVQALPDYMLTAQQPVRDFPPNTRFGRGHQV